MNIARAIRTCRLARRLSQQELAKRVDISPSYLSLLEGGRKEPSLPLLRDLAEALELSIDLLMLTAIDYDSVKKSHDVIGTLFSQMVTALTMDR